MHAGVDVPGKPGTDPDRSTVTSSRPSDAGVAKPEIPADAGVASDAGDGGAIVVADTALPPSVLPGDAVPPDAAVAPEAGPPAAIVPPPRCESARPRSMAFRRVGQGPVSDDFTFDPQGHLISFNRNDLVRVMRDASFDVLARNVLGQRGGALRAMPNGDLVMGDFQRDSVSLRSAGGQTRTLSGQVEGTMKMVRGPKGTVYITNKNGTIYRVEVATGATSHASDTSREWGGLTFALDYKTLYAGALDTQNVYAFAVNADGSLGSPRVWRENQPRISAMTTDECGDVYVINEGDGRVRRMREGQPVEVLADLNVTYLWSLAFGSGQHGWSDVGLYVLGAGGGGLYEVAVGVGGQPAPLD
jgi:hypothetical protein